MADYVIEAIQSVVRGQHDQLHPDFLPDGQAARLVNTTIRGGLAASRPGLSTVTTLPATGKFQGASTYSLNGGDRLVCVISGAVWVYSVEADSWTNPYTFPVTDFDRAYFCQAGQYFVVQNGVYSPTECWPLILDGDDVLDNLGVRFIWQDAPSADPDNGWRAISDFGTQTATEPERDSLRVPIGKSMAYLHGRLFVAVSRYWEDGATNGEDPHWVEDLGLRYWLAGQIAKPDNPAECFVFDDSQYLTGKAMGLPAELGLITAMAPFRNAATGSGYGALVFLAQRGASAFAPAADRDEWSQVDMSQVLFATGGSLSPWSLIPVNSDLIYFGRDGLRTIKYSSGVEGPTGGVACVPFSPEVANYIRLTTENHMPYVSSAAADNYVFVTAAGTVLSDGSTAFRAILPWDSSVILASGEKAPTAFAGAWGGELYLGLVGMRIAGRDVACALYRETDTGDTKVGVLDIDTGVAPAAQVSRVYTKRYAFKAFSDIKKLNRAELKFSNIYTALTFRVGWRVDGDTSWHWTDIGAVTPTTTPGATNSIWVAFPTLNLSSFNGRTVNAGEQFQFVVEWTGSAQLEYARFVASLIASSTGQQAACLTTTALSASSGEDLSAGTELDSIHETMYGSTT